MEKLRCGWLLFFFLGVVIFACENEPAKTEVHQTQQAIADSIRFEKVALFLVTKTDDVVLFEWIFRGEISQINSNILHFSPLGSDDYLDDHEAELQQLAQDKFPDVNINEVYGPKGANYELHTSYIWIEAQEGKEKRRLKFYPTFYGFDGNLRLGNERGNPIAYVQYGDANTDTLHMLNGVSVPLIKSLKLKPYSGLFVGTEIVEEEIVLGEKKRRTRFGEAFYLDGRWDNQDLAYVCPTYKGLLLLLSRIGKRLVPTQYPWHYRLESTQQSMKPTQRL